MTPPWSSIGGICAVVALVLVVIAWAMGKMVLLLPLILVLLAVSRLV